MRDLIVFGEDWGGLPSSTQHLVKHLANDRKVLWVNSIGLRRPRANWYDMKRIVLKVLRCAFPTFVKSASDSTLQNIHIVNPMAIPVPKTKIERVLSAFLLKKQLHKHIEKLNQPILWTSLPTVVDLIGQLNESAVVYYCGDDFSGLAGVDHADVSQYEQQLIEKSDLIITASKQLSGKFPTRKSIELLHGVDVELFSQPVKRADDLPLNGKPIAGFYGSLSDWLDIKLLSGVIAAMPHWDFVFIGRESADVAEIKQYPNTHFLGEKAHNQLPRYSQHWQVSLLPFIKNAQIQSCNPLKLMEYLAVGQPIISTSFPAADIYGDVIHRVDSVDDFIETLEASKYFATKDFKKTTQIKVVDKSWASKAQLLSQSLESL